MNTLDYDWLRRLNPCLLGSELFMSGQKVKYRKVNLLTCKQVVHIIVEQINIHCIQIFIVLFAKLIRRRLLSLHKIVIRPQIKRFQTMDSKLYAESLGERCFSGRRRSGYEYDSFLLLCYHIRNLNNLAFMQGFRNLYEFLYFAFVDSAVQIRNVAYLHQLAPALFFPESFVQSLFVDILRDFVRF